MRLSVENQLREINRTFYDQMSGPFARSRSEPWPGFALLADWLPTGRPDLLDVGCGEGRLGRYLRNYGRINRYVGVDQSEYLLARAARSVEGDYMRRDLAEPGALAGVGSYAAITCVATLQHVPGRAQRLRLLREMAGHLIDGGRLLLVNWQFLSSERQRRKLADWQDIGLNPQDVDPGDYLVRWDRGGRAVRYVAQIDGRETLDLAAAAGLDVLQQVRSDGREGDLNLYTQLARRGDR